MSKIWWYSVVALTYLWACSASKILVVFPMPSRSHSILGEGIVRALINDGHEVTYITPYLIKNPHVNIRQIDVSSNWKAIDALDIKAILDKEITVADPRKFFNMTMTIVKQTILSENVQKICNDPKESFDLVIMEWMFSELYAGFATVFECPYIWMSSIEPHSFILSLIDDHLNPAYNPGMLTASVPPFTFLERAKEMAIHLASTLLKDIYFESIEAEEFKILFGPMITKRGRPIPNYVDVKYNASLVLGNSHASIGQPTRLPQNYKDIRGYHIDQDVKPLPKDLQKILDDAKDGLIYFSMGSNLKSKDFPDVLKQKLLKVFGEMKQTVLWKFEENFPNLPSNVHVVQWAPQPSILAHPNCILFVTHGGGLSTTEAVYFAKPTIGIPVFGDQFTNIERAVKRGISKRVDLSYNMAEDLKVAIADIISNASYAAKVKEVSWIYHHRPVHPSVEVAHWVRHVIETGGAPHLRSAALQVPLYQKLFLDVIAALLAILYAIYFVIKSVIKRLFKKETKPDKTKVKKKNK